MREAAVGFQCPECVRAGAKSVRQPRTVAGGVAQVLNGQVTRALIGLNVAAYLLGMAWSGFSVWAGMTTGDVFFNDEIYRFVTANFVHFGILHLLLNMLALWMFGNYVESALGRWRYVVSLVLLGLGSSVSVYLWSPTNALSGGASGIVFGLFGIAFLLMIRRRDDLRSMLVLLAVNGLFSWQGGISWQAHLGGFLVGVALGALFVYAPRVHRDRWHVAGVVVIGLVLAAAAAFRSAQLDALVNR